VNEGEDRSLHQREGNMRIVCYMRCSTDDRQTVASQRAEIEAYLKARSPTKVRWFEDLGHSGGRLDRPAFQRMMADVRRRRFDVLVCYRLDRVSRSLFDAVAVLDELRRHDVRLVTLADGISFDGPYGRLMYALVAGLAELEREAIRERVRAGLRAARARGVRLGRAPADIDEGEARRRRAEGQTMKQVADHFRVNVRTLQRYLNQGDKIPPRPAR
jgi:DNA invertase Pin-like site-specific DNA recombinase